MARTPKRSAVRRAKPTVTWDTVREMGKALPEVEEGTTYGTPALKVRGQMFACVPSNRAAEPDSLVLCLSFDARDELIEAEPGTYYVKEHYVPYASVLVRLSKIHPDALRDLLRASHDFVLSKARKKK
jgi:hypothetical protein